MTGAGSRRALSLIALLLAAPPLAGQEMPRERVTLTQALERAVRLDPNYVQAVGRFDNAEWGRRAARLAFIIPSLSAQLDATKFSRPSFNIGTATQTDVAVNARVNLSYELLSLRKFTDLRATAAGFEGAGANLEAQRFQTALGVEGDFYQVTTDAELLRVARERTDRAQQQLQVARARVLSGAAVQTDSLTLVTELIQAQIALLRQGVALDVSRAQLGRRIGADGPVDADTTGASRLRELPVSLPDAVSQALAQGPQYRAARASERQAQALLKGSGSTYFPSLTINASNQTFDSKFFPTALSTQQVQLVVSIPIWNLGQRETQRTIARLNRDVARAVRSDLERAALRDVTEAYGGYQAAHATIALAEAAVAAARENYRVQDLRYRSGATTILDLIEAQFRLAQAESDAVQSRFASRLALAGLEAILGRRLFPTN